MDIPSEIKERDKIIKKYSQLVDILYDHIREMRRNSREMDDADPIMASYFAKHQERVFNRIEEHELLMEAITAIYGKQEVQPEAKQECCQASKKECCQNSKTSENNDSISSQQETKREVPNYKKALCSKKWPPEHMTGVSCGCLGEFKLLGVVNEWNVDARENVYILECKCGMRAKIENGVFYVLVEQTATGRIVV